MAVLLDVGLLLLLFLIAVLATVDWIRYRDSANVEGVLLFATIALGMGLVFVADHSHGLTALITSTLGAIFIVLFPIMLLRIVGQFRRVPWSVWLTAGMGAAVFTTAIAIQVGLPVPTPFDLAVAATSLAYIGLIALYASSAFLRGAVQTKGIPQRRLRLASAATTLLGLSVAGFLASAWAPRIELVAGLLAMAAFLFFFFAFTPPRALSQAWWAMEVRRFLEILERQRVHDLEGRARIAVETLVQMTQEMVGAEATFVWLRSDNRMRLVAPGLSARQRWVLRKLCDPAWRRSVDLHRVQVVSRRNMSERDRQIAEVYEAKVLGFVPLKASRGRRGTLTVVMASPPLFLRDTLRALELMGSQAAHAVEIAEASRREQGLVLQRYRAESSTLQREKIALEEASRLKSRFLANMSHELRTPLNSIVGFSELISTGRLGQVDAVARGAVDDILTSAHHLKRIIDDILDLAKVEAGRIDLRPVRVQVRQVCEEVIATLQGDVAERQLDTAIVVDEGAEEVIVDPTRLRQVLYNFVSNAIKFSPEGGTITIRVLARPQGRFRLQVSDQGPGVAKEDQGRLFQAFERIKPDGSKQGTGLGLALVKQIVEAQGGEVGVHSTHGKGATFYADIPRSPPAPAPARDMERPAVLLVEQDHDEGTRLAGVMRRQGYDVDHVATETEASKRVGQRRYHAAVLDIIMPDGDGHHLLESLHDQEIPVVIVSMAPREELAWAVQPHEFLRKPVQAQRLIDALRRAGVHAGVRDRILVVDDDEEAVQQLEHELRGMDLDILATGDETQARRLVRRHSPQAVIIDLAGPVHGFAFIDWLQTDRHTRNLPVIVWTRRPLGDVERRRLRRRAGHVLSKQDGHEALLSALASAVPDKARLEGVPNA